MDVEALTRLEEIANRDEAKSVTVRAHDLRALLACAAALSADLSMAQAAAETARNACDHWEARVKELERERDSWREQFYAASNAASEYVGFWERHHGDFDAAGNYIPHSQMDGDLRAAEARVTALAAEVERMREAMLWIDHYEPELVASAEAKFGFSLSPRAVLEGKDNG